MRFTKTRLPSQRTRRFACRKADLVRNFVTATFLLFMTSVLFAAEPNWNQFRGPNHDNKSFTTGIAKTWPEEGPRLLWKKDDLGQGYSHLSFFDDWMFTAGDIGEQCLLIAMDRHTGERKWASVIGRSGVVGRYFGPRATPSVDGKHVFAYGQYGDLLCVEMATGKEVWRLNAERDWGGKFMNNWGFSSSPILDDERILLPVGGQGGTLVAFDKDGKTLWRTKSLKDNAPYCSIVPAVLGGLKQYLLFTGTGLYGVDVKNGAILWGTDRPTDRPVCSDPVYKDDVVLVSSAYRMGSYGYRVTKKGDAFSAEEIYRDTRLLNHHGGMILHGDHVYMTSERNLACMEIRTGKVLWENRSVGKGSLTFVDGHLIVRSESGDGTVALVEANPEKYVEKGRFDQPDRSDKNSWTYPMIVDGRLYVRDQNVLLCYDLRP